MPRLKKEVKAETKKKKGKPIKSLDGNCDILFNEFAVWNKIICDAKSICSGFDIQEVNLPVIESTDLYKKSIFQNSDPEEESLISFDFKKGDKFSLRPDMTPGIVRSYVETDLSKLPKPIKLFYKGPVFMKSEKDSINESYQFGVEAFGDIDPAIDAQMIYIIWKIFQKSKIKNISIQINTIGCSNCRNKYRKFLTDYYDMKIRKLCSSCKKKVDKNPMRILDCKEEKCVQASCSAPQIIDNLCTECHDNFKSVLEFLDELEIPYVLNPNLIRNSDYYNGTIFEVFVGDNPKNMVSMGGGGRYDDLIRSLGGEDTPAIGFSFDVGKLAKKMIDTKVTNYNSHTKDVFLVQLGDKARKKIIKIFDKLIDDEISVGESLANGGIKNQLRIAQKMKAKIALIVGQKEAIDDTVIVRDMESGIQEIVSVDRISEKVKKMLNS